VTNEAAYFTGLLADIRAESAGLRRFCWLLFDRSGLAEFNEPDLLAVAM